LKKVLLSLIVFGFAVSAGFADAKGTKVSSGRDHSVSGHVTKNGTYVAPHRATNPNGTKNDNYSTKSNINPYTGKAGTKKRDGE